jgi:hypothetical protein
MQGAVDMPSSPPERSVSASYEAPHDAAPASMPDAPREAAPERDFSPPPRSEPVETGFRAQCAERSLVAAGAKLRGGASRRGQR